MTSLLIRNFIYECVRIMNLFFGAKKPRIAIFCYHSISGDGWRFSVRAQEFKKQINHLIKTYTPIKASELPEYISGKKEIEKNMFVLTFDDGYEDIFCAKNAEISAPIFWASLYAAIPIDNVGFIIKKLSF